MVKEGRKYRPQSLSKILLQEIKLLIYWVVIFCKALDIMKRSCRQQLQHINGLPKELVTEILLCLPIKDAVKTSVLSKKWRYTWTELPKLVFDNRFCEGLIKNTKSKIIMAISQVLMLHRGPLDWFKLSLTYLKSCAEIDQFVLFVLRAGVKNLILKRPEGQPYRLPSSIFAYDQQLEFLKLRYCVFKPPIEFTGFSKLKFLELLEVGISGHTFSSLISNCPLLETLNFESSTNCGQLDIVAPNLENFSFKGLCELICFTNTPELAFVKIYFSGDDDFVGPGHCKLSGRLPVVEELFLDYYYSKYLTVNGAMISLVNDLCHLETLHLLHIYFSDFDEVSSVLCLVKNAKNLENLTIEVHTDYSEPDINLTKVESFLEVTLDHLRNFNLLGVSGSNCEMQFMELILAKSPVLKKCKIRPNSELVGEKGCKFFKELSRFRRASPHVEIDYED